MLFDFFNPSQTHFFLSFLFGLAFGGWGLEGLRGGVVEGVRGGGLELVLKIGWGCGMGMGVGVLGEGM